VGRGPGGVRGTVAKTERTRVKHHHLLTTWGVPFRFVRKRGSLDGEVCCLELGSDVRQTGSSNEKIGGREVGRIKKKKMSE